MECVAWWSIDSVLHGRPPAMRRWNSRLTAEGRRVIPNPSIDGVAAGVSVNVWNAKHHFLERVGGSIDIAVIDCQCSNPLKRVAWVQPSPHSSVTTRLITYLGELY